MGILQICIQKTFCYLLQEIHCKVNSLGISSRNLDISRMRSSTAEKDTVIILQKLFCSDVNTNIDIGNNFTPSSSISFSLRSMIFFSSFMFGMP